MTAPEAKLKTDIRRYLTKEKIFWSSIQNGFGAKPGDPDLICCVNGMFLALEVKTPDGRATEIQAQRAKEIIDCWGIHFFVRSLDDVKKAIAYAKDVSHRLSYALELNNE